MWRRLRIGEEKKKKRKKERKKERKKKPQDNIRIFYTGRP